MKGLSKLGHPVFLVSVLVLILNDWVLKEAFHNALTGKLSDFAGLFAFPYLVGALFPKRARPIHLFTALLFVFWKSELSQPLIETIHNWGYPLYRVVDFTDNMALVSVFCSFLIFQQETTIRLKRTLTIPLAAISCLAFMATTRPPQKQKVELNKEYQFDFSKRELVSRFNALQIEEVRRWNKWVGHVDYNSDTNVFYFQGQQDTLALLLDYSKVKDQDVITWKNAYAEIQIEGNEEKSLMRLVAVYQVSPGDNRLKEKALKQFEKRIVKKIKAPRKNPFMAEN